MELYRRVRGCFWIKVLVDKMKYYVNLRKYGLDVL